MRIRLSIHIILPGLLLICLFVLKEKAGAATIACSGKISTTDTAQPSSFPGIEMVSPQMNSACHFNMQKKLTGTPSLPSDREIRKRFLSEDIFIKQSLLLLRNYLSRIYPFHYFW